MGTIRNEMTIVHHFEKDALEKLREDAIKAFKEVAIERDKDIIDRMVSPIMESFINQEYTFVINGDCSKVGWDIATRFHETRMEWCKKHKDDVEAIVVINFGEGDDPCSKVFDNTGYDEVVNENSN